MEDAIRASEQSVETHAESCGPCAGGMENSQDVSQIETNARRLKSVKDGRVKLVLPQKEKMRVFNPTSWYVAEVKRCSELKCRDILNNPQLFDYKVEAYVASQPVVIREAEDSEIGTVLSEKVVIRGKIFIRVDERYRIDLLKKCSFLIRYMKDPSLSRTPSGFTNFARVPDVQIQQLRQILTIADGPVKYTAMAPQVHDTIQIIGGQLTKGKLFSNLRGEISKVSGRKYATVILDGIGALKFRLPIKDISKLVRQGKK